MKLLLVEDNAAMLATLARSFERRGVQVATCADGARALDRWRAAVPDVVVLDLTLPGVDGLEVLAQARAEGLAAPVLILTARGTVGDRILGLNTGADDYLPKPFDLDELEARVRALARRAASADGAESHLAHAAAEFCGLRCEADSGAIYLHGKVFELAPREAALMRALLARPGHAVVRERLVELVFPGQSEISADAIDVVAYRLRKRLVATETKLVALRGLGYLLAPKA
jgi:two-component system, OmpR family, response regulator TctD